MNQNLFPYSTDMCTYGMSTPRALPYLDNKAEVAKNITSQTGPFENRTFWAVPDSVGSWK